MDLSRISAEVRPRNSWESIDLGFKMARQWYRPLFLLWLAVTLPFFIVLQWVFLEDGLWAYLAIWWLKPIWERLLLQYLSHRLFSEELKLFDQLKSFPSLIKRQWFQSLVWRRLSATRSFDLPVLQLEGLGGDERARRLGLLHRSSGSAAFWLTTVCLHIEAILSIGLAALVYLLIPAQMDIEWLDLMASSDIAIQLLTNVGSYIAMAVVAPFYVAGGFSLYLNRRTELEGWDIELAFRRLLQRKDTQKYRSGSSMTAVLMALVFLSSCLLSPDTIADELKSDKERSRQVIQEVLDGDDFHVVEVQEVPKFIMDWEWDWDFEEPEGRYKTPGWLKSLLFWLAKSAEMLLWVLVALLVVFLLFRYREWLQQVVVGLSTDRQDKAPLPPSSLFGLELNADTLPELPADMARDLWEQGRYRESVSLLYRASLHRLIVGHQLEFHDGNTEGECISIVDKHLPGPIADNFVRLTRCWQLVAYAGSWPDSNEMNQLFDQWPKFFGEHNESADG